MATALRGEASRQAAMIAAEAARDEARTLLDARAEAARIVREARAGAEVVAARAASAALVRARADARTIVLMARRQAYEALRLRVLEELAARRDTAEVEALLATMEGWARARIGGPAEVGHEGVAGLDVVARRGARRVVVRASDVVDRQLATMAHDLERLWS